MTFTSFGPPPNLVPCDLILRPGAGATVQAAFAYARALAAWLDHSVIVDGNDCSVTVTPQMSEWDCAHAYTQALEKCDTRTPKVKETPSLYDEQAARQLGWGAGWSAAIERMRVLIVRELADLEARLRLNREDFPDDHPAVSYLQEHITSLRKIAGELDIFLPP